MTTRLNDKQTDLLRYLCRQSGPVPVDHLDGRVVRALVERDLIGVKAGWVSPTDLGRTFLSAPTGGQHRRGRAPREQTRPARAQSILKVVDELQRLIPIDAELRVGEVPAYADDVLDGLRKLARAM